MLSGYVMPGWWNGITPVTYGYEACKSGHSYGPAVRRYYLLHYVLEGRGEFFHKDGTYTIGPGEIFVILPGEVTTYRADRDNPWHYVWLGFESDIPLPFLEEPVLRQKPVRHVFDSLVRYCGAAGVESKIYALMYDLLWMLQRGTGEPERQGKSYAAYTKAYLEDSYMFPVCMQTLAERLHIDRRYMTAVFREAFGVSPQAYLTELRLRRARDFLQQGYPVGEAALMAGFSDPANFSRKYRQRFGVSPVTDRNNVSNS